MKSDRRQIRFFFAGVAVCVLTISSFAQTAKKDEHAGHHHEQSAAENQDAQKGEKEFLGKGDGITTCPVMGSPVDKELKFEWKGQTYYVCCSGCLDMLKESPELYLKPPKKQEAGHQEHQGHQEQAEQAKPAGEAKFLGKGDGIESCPVTGEPIDKEVKAEIWGRTVYACCPPCLDSIKKEPELYLKKK